MVTEETVEKAYVGYFQDVALFLLELENTRRKVASGEWENYTLEQMRSLNEILYSDILDKNYERSYACLLYTSRHPVACQTLYGKAGCIFQISISGRMAGRNQSWYAGDTGW